MLKRRCLVSRYKAYYDTHREEILAKAKIRYSKNREKIRQYYNDYARIHHLTVSGVKLRNLNKRTWTGYCELCGKERKNLAYHHWDDENSSKGIWVCHMPCHQICEAVDHKTLDLAQIYIRMKRMLNKKYKLRKELKPNLN